MSSYKYKDLDASSPKSEQLLAYIDSHKSEALAAFVIATVLVCGMGPRLVQGIVGCDAVVSEQSCDNLAADDEANLVVRLLTQPRATIQEYVLN